MLHNRCLELNIGIMDVGGLLVLGLAVHPDACLVGMFFELGEGESPRALPRSSFSSLSSTLVSLSCLACWTKFDVIDIAANDVKCLVGNDPWDASTMVKKCQ